MFLSLPVALPLQYDPQATGSIDYQQLMKQLLHSDYYALYLGTVDNTQNTLEATAVASLGSSLRSRIRPQAERLQKVGNFSAQVPTLCCVLLICRQHSSGTIEFEQQNQALFTSSE